MPFVLEIYCEIIIGKLYCVWYGGYELVDLDNQFTVYVCIKNIIPSP